MLMIGMIALLFVVTIIGGYAFNWTWTGYSSNDTLWDWLNLVLLPVTIAFLPVWVATRETHRSHWRIGLVLFVAAFVVTLIGGYELGWNWTGYESNKLWDWIKLLFVPAVIPILALWLQQEASSADQTPRHRA